MTYFNVSERDNMKETDKTEKHTKERERVRDTGWVSF